MSFPFRRRKICLQPLHFWFSPEKTRNVSSYSSTGLHLFLDSYNCRLECVLPHNGNVYRAVSVGHTVHLLEEYNDIKMIIGQLEYHENNWIIFAGVKMVNFLLAQQQGFIKYSYYLCIQNYQIREKCQIQKKWPIREILETGIYSG